jgi:nucleotide-binding universal stress UspA family protein
MYRRILVAFDGSKGATAALSEAAKLADICDAELLLLTVYRHYSLLEASLSMVRPVEPNMMDDAMREHAEEVVGHGKSEAARLGARKVRGFVVNGPVARGIVSFAQEHDVDLIVLGSRGLGSLDDYLLGSVSHKVTGMAKKPVLVV